MHLIDQFCCVVPMYLIACSNEQLEKVANGECISPKVSLRTQRSLADASGKDRPRRRSLRGRTSHAAMRARLFLDAVIVRRRGTSTVSPFGCVVLTIFSSTKR